MVFLRLVLVLTLAAVAVTGCGRRGALQPPPGAENSIEPKRDPGAGPEESGSLGSLDTLTEEGRVSAEAEPGASEKEQTSDPDDRPFILDPLI